MLPYKGQEDLNYDEVIPPALWIGSKPHEKEDIRKLVDELGVTDIIDLTSEFPKSDTNLIRVHKFPVVDKTPPTSLRAGAEIVKKIEECLQNDGVVYVHCRWGIGRAATIVLLYLMSLGLSLDKAYHFLKGKRNKIHPSQSQWDYLKRYEKHVNS